MRADVAGVADPEVLRDVPFQTADHADLVAAALSLLHVSASLRKARTLSRICFSYFFRIRRFFACLYRCHHFFGTSPRAMASQIFRTVSTISSMAGRRASAICWAISLKALTTFSAACRMTSFAFSICSAVAVEISGSRRGSGGAGSSRVSVMLVLLYNEPRTGAGASARASSSVS